MSFTPGVPFDGESLGQSKVQVRNNFGTLRSGLSNTIQPNHVDLINTGGLVPGKHVFVQMPVQTPGAANLPAALEGGLITQTVASGSELFFAHDAIATWMQMTGPVFTAQGALGKGGTTMLFGGIILKWGAVENAIQGPPYSFATQTGSDFPNNVWVMINSIGTSPSLLTLTQFNFPGLSGNPTFFIAIGN